MSRPTELTEALIKMAAHYADSGFSENSEALPTISGLALYLGKSKSSLHSYADQSEEMADILDRIKCRQEVMLINGGLHGDFNAGIAKLMLANHGYNEKQAIDHTSNGHSINYSNMPTVIEFVAPDFEEYTAWRDQKQESPA